MLSISVLNCYVVGDHLLIQLSQSLLAAQHAAGLPGRPVKHGPDKEQKTTRNQSQLGLKNGLAIVGDAPRHWAPPQPVKACAPHQDWEKQLITQWSHGFWTHAQDWANVGYMPLPREQPPRTLYRKPYNQTIMGGPQLTHTETTDAARSMVVTVSCDSRKEGRKEGREEGRKGGREEGRKGGREEGRKDLCSLFSWIRWFLFIGFLYW